MSCCFFFLLLCLFEIFLLNYSIDLLPYFSVVLIFNFYTALIFYQFFCFIIDGIADVRDVESKEEII